MKPFLESVIIENHDGKLRELQFESGMNIITGSGSKGKSALLRIVEYCLGGPDCKIPVGRVRDSGAWYYLALNVNEQKVIIGRKGPSSTGRPSEMAYFRISPNAVVPESDKLQVGINTACKLLGDVLGIPSERFELGMDPLMQTRMQLPELLPLLVQPQDIIATQQLFASVPSADPRGASARWTQTVKIALKIIRPDLLFLRERERTLVQKRDALRRRRSEAQARQSAANRHVQYLWQQAVMADFAPSGRFSSVDEIRVGLERMRDTSTSEMTASVASSQLDARIVELEAQSRELRSHLRQSSQELRQIERIRDASRGASGSLGTQSARLRAVKLLGAPNPNNIPCPLCGTELGTDNEDLLVALQRDLDDELTFVASIPPELDAVEEELRRELRNTREQLRATEAQLDALQNQDPAPTLTEERVRRERLIGALDHALSVVSEMSVNLDPGETDAIEAELEDVRQQIRTLDAEKDEWEVREILNSRMVLMAGNLKRMQLNGDTLAFDRHFSTISRGRADRMSELSSLGGAENYVMYHVCAFLALHEQLSRGSFVPPLLILDQPSQTYFPSKSDTTNTDFEAVRSIYELMFRVLAECGNRFQIIALDHADFSADDRRFAAAKRYDWHGDDGLIPNSWST